MILFQNLEERNTDLISTEFQYRSPKLYWKLKKGKCKCNFQRVRIKNNYNLALSETLKYCLLVNRCLLVYRKGVQNISNDIQLKMFSMIHYSTSNSQPLIKR